MHSNRKPRPARRFASRRALALAGAMVLVNLAFAAAVYAQDELTVEKLVSQVNGAAPPATEVISVSPGDTVGYAISVSSIADLGGTDITIRDVFEAQVLDFQEGSAGCDASAEGEVTCTLTLDDAGATEVELTFRVLEVEACRRLVNTVEVTGEPDLTASAEAEIEACPTGGGGGGDGADGDGSGQGGGDASPGTGGDGTNQPNTAMPYAAELERGPSPATIAGVMLILLAGLATLRLVLVGRDAMR
jgi:hypothetical protein